MKKLIPFLSLILLASCGTKESENSKSQMEITYSIDTVMIDSKSHFLYLSEALGRSFLAKDGKTLYNLNQKLPQLEVIDLSLMELVDTIPMEREGPAGIGAFDFYDGVQVLENGEIFIFAWEEIVRLSADRKSVEKYRFSATNLTGDSLKQDEEIRYEGLISEDGTHFFTFYGNSAEFSSRLGLAIINLEEMSLKKVDLPLFEELIQFEIQTETNTGYPYTHVEAIHFTQYSDQLLISLSPINEVYNVDISAGTYSHFPFSSSLTANRVEVTYPTISNSTAGTTEAVRDRWKQVSFYKMNWDQETQRFWRITNQTEIFEEKENTNKAALTFFDRDLNQLRELRLPENWKIMGAPFISQGMYWQFMNINDELAFVRLKPNFKGL
jgi:hypothetical protein